MFATINYIATTDKGTSRFSHFVCQETGESRGYRFNGTGYDGGEASPEVAARRAARCAGEELINLQYSSGLDVARAQESLGVLAASSRLVRAEKEQGRLVAELSDYLPGFDDEVRADILVDIDKACIEVASARQRHREAVQKLANIEHPGHRIS